MERKIGRIFLLVFLLAFSGCGAIRDKIPFMGKKEIRVGGVYKENLDPDRLVDLIIVKKLTGEKRLGLFSKYTPFLEGYIRGVVVDYDDNPIEGVVVRVTDKGKDIPGFDPGVSDINGVYKIRFSQPFKKKKIDIKAVISYNPPWQQQIEILGASLEPQTKETQFRLYFNRSTGVLGIGEDSPKTIVRKATPDMIKEKDPKDSRRERSSRRYGADRPTEKFKPNLEAVQQAEGAKPSPKKNEDFFGGFGDFGN